MNWVKLLKPDCRKIVMFLIILILANLPVIGYTKNQITCEPICENPYCYCLPTMNLNIILYPFLQYFSGFLEVHDITYGIPVLGIIQFNILYPPQGVPSHAILYFAFLFANIVYWYLLSCVIIEIYNRLNKKRLKKK